MKLQFVGKPPENYWEWVLRFHRESLDKFPSGIEALAAMERLHDLLAKDSEKVGLANHPLRSRLSIGYEPNYQWIIHFVKKLEALSKVSGHEHVLGRLADPRSFATALEEMDFALPSSLEIVSNMRTSPLQTRTMSSMKAVSRPVRMEIEVSKLLLDPSNFRILEGHGKSQAELLKILEENYSVLDVGRSIADNGYFSEEPLSAIEEKGSYRVIEGNRRLAALKFLLDPDSRKNSSNFAEWEKLASNLKVPIVTVPVIVYKDRDEITAFLGFRHITGIMKWEPLAKARFIDALVEKQGNAVDFSEIGKMIGSRANTIRANYVAYRTLLEARDDFSLDTSKVEQNFSVFYRALTYSSIANFVKLNVDNQAKALRKPISAKMSTQLEELIGFIHGTKDVEPVLTDSRKLTDLGQVLMDSNATSILRSTRDLSKAHELVGGEEKRLASNLSLASYYLDQSLREAHRHTKVPKIVELVTRCGGTMSQILSSFPTIRETLVK